MTELIETPLSELAETANGAAAAAERHASDAVDKAIEAGDALNEAKRQCGHGDWAEWLNENWEYSDRMARKYMKLASAKGQPAIKDCKSMSEGLKAIADASQATDSTPSKGRNRNRGSDLDSPQQEGAKQAASTPAEYGAADGDYEDVEDDDAPVSPPAKPARSASLVQDKNGNDVPESLRDHFSLGAQLESIARKLDAVKREAVEAAAMPGGEFLPVQQVELDAKDLKDLIAGAAYWSHCPRCEGDGCKRCDETGFIPRSKKGHLSKADKEAIGS